jgi:hypothetical protein
VHARREVDGGDRRVRRRADPHRQDARHRLFDVATKEEAVDLARSFVALHRDIMGNGYEMEVEVRQMHDMPPGAG